jgi:hypothetical protein
MDSYKLLGDWRKGRLRKEDVKEYLREGCDNDIAPLLTDEELDHVADCCMSIYNWYREGLRPGHFLTGVLLNDLDMAVGCADHTNKKALALYIKFLYNVAPGDWREKAKELRGRER